MSEFRVYCKSMGKMGDVAIINYMLGTVTAEIEGRGYLLQEPDYIRMQSTGLFDKNRVKRVEIFEGDVVKVHRFTENFSENGGFYEGEEELIGIIEYGYPDYEVQNIGKVYPPRWGLKTNFDWLDLSNLYGIHEESFEVIGNIYENPELVEEANNVDD